MPLSKPLIRRIAKQAGASRVASTLYTEVQKMYEDVLETLLKNIFILVKAGAKRKTIKLGDVRQALKSMGLDVLIDPKQKSPFPVATFRRDIAAITPDLINPNRWSPKFAKDAILGMISFLHDYLFRYIRSAVGLDAHSEGKTVKARDIKNVCTICGGLPDPLHKPEGVPQVDATLPTKKKKKKKKKKKTKSKLTRTGTEIMEEDSPVSEVY